LEELILTGALEDGSRLPSEKDLGEQFGVSRNAVREALKSLEARGLVRVENGKGAFTTAPTTDTVQGALGRYIQARLGANAVPHLYEIRRVLEGAAARACAERATEEDIDRLWAALTRMEGHQDDVDAWMEADLTFHRAMLMATHNPFFTILLEPIVTQIGETIKLSFGTEGTRAGVVSHRAVLERIAARDGLGAERAMLAVLQDSAARVITVLDTPADRTGDGLARLADAAPGRHSTSPK
jgi:DNA-binding FadR family transcriptional regulator